MVDYTRSHATTKTFLSILLLVIGVHSVSVAQLISTEYPQNRVQHEQDNWLRYESESFNLMFAEEDEALAEFTLPVAEKAYFEIKMILEYRMRNPIELFIYSDYSDFEQSNIGLSAPAVNSAGTTKLLDNKILVYFDGNHDNLRKQIREGIAQTLINRMLFGSNLQEVFQNSVLMHLPEWFTEGLVAYTAEEWNTEKDDQLRDIFLNNKYRHFIEMATEHPRLAGHALFHFIAHEYSPSHVSNLVYLTRINRSVESGFIHVFGTSFYGIVGSKWYNYYADRYNNDNQNRLFPNKGEIPLSSSKHLQINHIAMHPNGNYLAYIQDIQGIRQVMIRDINNEEDTKVFKTGLRTHQDNYDQHYPLIAWTKTSRKLVVIYNKKDKIYFEKYSSDGKQVESKTEIEDLEHIIGFDVLGENTFVLSALKDGQTDLYLYYADDGELRALTDDMFDDLHPSVVNWGSEKGIVFASNRQNPSIALSLSDSASFNNNFDLYFYNTKTKSQDLIRITNTPMANEYAITQAGSNKVAYLSDETGITNRFVATMDSIVVDYRQIVVLENGEMIEIPQDSIWDESVVVSDTIYETPIYAPIATTVANTDYSRNLLLQHSNEKGTKISDLFYKDGAYHLFVRDFSFDRTKSPANTQYRTLSKQPFDYTSKKKSQPSTSSVEPEKTEEVSPEIARELELVEAEINAKNTNSTDTIPPTDSTKIDVENYLFQSEYETVEQPNIANTTTPSDTTGPEGPFILEEGEDGNLTSRPSNPRPRNDRRNRLSFDRNAFEPSPYYPDQAEPYKNTFKIDEIAFLLDNTPMYNGYEMYLGGNYAYAPLGLMFKTSFSDLFEHYKVEVGVRLPTTFNGMEYFINFDNNKHLIDQRYSIYRRGRIDQVVIRDTTSGFEANVRARNIKHLVQADLRYPLSQFHTIRATPYLQMDRIAVIAEDPITVSVPEYTENRVGLRLEFDYSNAVNIRVNAKKGTSVKFYTELIKPFAINTEDRFSVDLTGGLTTAIGMDLRHYIALDNKAVFAVRFAGATSFGKQKMLYSIGGTENWLFPTFSETIPLPEGGNYAYQVAAPNLRGFDNGIRNGSSYALINAELRIPVMDYLSRNPSRNMFLRNLQITGFFDMGTAWQGASPFAKDNPLNTTVIDPGDDPNTVSPIRVRVNYYRTPIVSSFGVGMRSVILGYYLRLDYAWGIETGQIQAPMLHLSLGTDF